jgi:hypothetical protein
MEIRELLEKGAITWEDMAEKTLTEKRLQSGDAMYVLREGEIIEQKRMQDSWAYRLRKLCVDKQYLSCVVVVDGNFLIITEIN